MPTNGQFTGIQDLLAMLAGQSTSGDAQSDDAPPDDGSQDFPPVASYEDALQTPSYADYAAPDQIEPTTADYSAPSYNVTPPDQQPQYIARGPNRLQHLRPLEPLTPIGAEDKYAHQEDLARFRAEQQFGRQQDREAARNDTASMQQTDVMARWAQDVPPAVIQGVNDGSLAYTPSQDRRLAEIKDTVAKIDNDPTWNAKQKELGKAKLWMEYKQIHSTPQPVPLNQRKITPDQQLAQSTVMRPVPIDENTTLQLPMVPVQRAGGTKWEATPDGQLLKEVTLLKLKQQHAIELARVRAELQAAKQNTNATHDFDTMAKHHSNYVTANLNRELQLYKLNNPEPQLANYKSTDPKSANSFDQEKWQADHARWAAGAKTIFDRHSVDQQFAPYVARQQQQIQDVGAAMGPLSMMPLPGGPETQDVSYGDDSSAPDLSYAAGNGQVPVTDSPAASQPPPGSVTVWSSADLKRALADPNLPSGSTIIWGPTGKSRAK